MTELEILVDVAGTAEWRRRKAEQYPEDTRNAKAAELLERLAQGIRQLEGSEVHRDLQTAIDSAALDRRSEFERSELDQVSEHLRSVGFGYQPASTEAFLKDLTEALRR